MNIGIYSAFFIDTILPYLNKTVDSPIGSQCPSSSSQSTGTEDVDINDLLEDVSLCIYVYVVNALKVHSNFNFNNCHKIKWEFWGQGFITKTILWIKFWGPTGVLLFIDYNFEEVANVQARSKIWKMYSPLNMFKLKVAFNYVSVCRDTTCYLSVVIHSLNWTHGNMYMCKYVAIHGRRKRVGRAYPALV